MNYMRLLQVLSIYIFLHAHACHGSLRRDVLFSPSLQGSVGVLTESKALGYAGPLFFTVYMQHTYYLMIKRASKSLTGQIVVHNSKGHAVQRYTYRYNNNGLALINTNPYSHRAVTLPAHVTEFIMKELNQYNAQ